jgi:conjugal transfer pilus assembly protein TraU
MKSLIKLCLLLGMLFMSNQAMAACKSSFINPITDIGWNCIFPINIGGVSMGPGEDTNTIDTPMCVCNQNGGVPVVGLRAGFWEPSRIIDTVSDPYCLMPLGTQLSHPKPGSLGGNLVNDTKSGSKRAFQQLHYYYFPAWRILDMFYDIPCIDQDGFDVAMLTEIIPTWNNDTLSLIINPEALLFANPVAGLACTADAAVSLLTLPRNELFWCMGSWGNAYPLAGSITSTDYVEANAGIAAKGIYFMGRTGMLWESTPDGCGNRLAPIWSKDRYKLQLMKPVRDSTCIPIGREGLLWTAGRHDPMKDNFMWMLFKKLDCCIRIF